MIDLNDPAFKSALERLKQGCLQAVADHKGSQSEYDVISLLAKADLFAFLGAPSGMLLLFYKHFLTMHCLYSLREYFQGEGYWLSISALSIELIPIPIPIPIPKPKPGANVGITDNMDTANTGSALNSAVTANPHERALSDCYLDLSPLSNATEDSVVELMAQFWQRFHSQDGVQSACDVLGVKSTDAWPDIMTAYRKKVASAHPDKGGEPEAFIAIKAAMDTLKLHFAK